MAFSHFRAAAGTENPVTVTIWGLCYSGGQVAVALATIKVSPRARRERFRVPQTTELPNRFLSRTSVSNREGSNSEACYPRQRSQQVFLADPLQSRIGLHQARLRRWLRTLRRLVDDAGDEDYRPWDPYMARIVDLVDAVKGLGSL